MSSAQERLAASLESPFAAPGEKKPDPEPAVRPTMKVRTFRRTVDLSVQRHHALKSWCDEQALALGVASVPGQHVLDELVGLLLGDVRTQDMLIAALRKRYDEE